MSSKEHYTIIEQIKSTFNISDINYFENDFTICAYENPELITKAIAMAKKGLKTNPSSIILLKFLGYAYALQNDVEKYVRCYHKVVSLDPKNYKNWIALSFSYRNKGDFLTSNWINYNVELFIKKYKEKGLTEMNHNNLLLIINELRKKGIDKC